jgi:serine protease Do
MQLTTLRRAMIPIGMAALLFTGQLVADRGIELKETATDFTGVAKKAIPAVVSIKVKESSKQSSGWDEEMSDDSSDDLGGGGRLWKKFFGLPFSENSPQREGQASGFLVSADGYIITNGHVVRNTQTISVHLNDGREMSAKVIGLDENTDIALIKIEGKGFPFLKLGDSDKIEIGQWVVAIGTPLGLEASLTAGVVSAKGRNNLDLARVEDFIQTDAALYHGNSGGPLLNLSADVIGINTAIASRMGGYIGIGFAIPSNIAKNVMDQLMSKGSVSRGFIGVLLQEIDTDLAAALELPKAEGVIIAQVSKDSPAEKAGIRQGDIITSYNGNHIINAASLRTVIAMMAPGTTLKLAIIRDGKPQTISLVVGEFASPEPLTTQKEEPSHHQKLGISVAEITPEISKKLKLDGEKGVVVALADTSGIGYAAGIRKGIVILAVNRQKIQSVDEFQKAVKDAENTNRPLLLLIKAGDTVQFVSIKLG